MVALYVMIWLPRITDNSFFLSFFLILLTRSNFDHYARECDFGILKEKKNRHSFPSPLEFEVSRVDCLHIWHVLYIGNIWKALDSVTFSDIGALGVKLFGFGVNYQVLPTRWSNWKKQSSAFIDADWLKKYRKKTPNKIRIEILIKWYIEGQSCFSHNGLFSFYLTSHLREKQCTIHACPLTQGFRRSCAPYIRKMDLDLNN